VIQLAEAPADYPGQTLSCPNCTSQLRLPPLTIDNWTIRSPKDVADRLQLPMSHLEREEIRVLLLNAKNRVIEVNTTYTGNVSASQVRVGELFRDAVRRDASGIILVHNHPSGDATPSADDLHLTAEAIAAGRLLDIDVLDHVVIGGDTWTSLRDRGVTFDRTGPKADLRTGPMVAS
jgi:DNA repair protein RadC